MAKQQKVTIRNKTYDLDDAADLVSIQNALVPENWPAKKAEGVRLFISLQNMLAKKFKQHFAANFKGLMKSAVEEGEDGGAARIGATFKFEIDVTVPQVAALSKNALNYSVKHGTEGKPQTHDLTQGEFLDEENDVILDTHAIESDNAQIAEEEKAKLKAEEAADKSKEKAAAEALPAAAVGGDVTAENTPGDKPVDKKPRKKKK